MEDKKKIVDSLKEEIKHLCYDTETGEIVDGESLEGDKYDRYRALQASIKLIEVAETDLNFNDPLVNIMLNLSVLNDIIDKLSLLNKLDGYAMIEQMCEEVEDYTEYDNENVWAIKKAFHELRTMIEGDYYTREYTEVE